MSRWSDLSYGGGATPANLIAATARGAEIAVGQLRREGMDDEAIRRRIITRFRDPEIAEDHGELVHETLMAVVQRGVEDALRAGVTGAPLASERPS